MLVAPGKISEALGITISSKAAVTQRTATEHVCTTRLRKSASVRASAERPDSQAGPLGLANVWAACFVACSAQLLFTAAAESKEYVWRPRRHYRRMNQQRRDSGMLFSVCDPWTATRQRAFQIGNKVVLRRDCDPCQALSDVIRSPVDLLRRLCQ